MPRKKIIYTPTKEIFNSCELASIHAGLSKSYFSIMMNKNALKDYEYYNGEKMNHDMIFSREPKGRIEFVIGKVKSIYPFSSCSKINEILSHVEERKGMKVYMYLNSKKRT